MEVRRVAIASLIPSPYNPRRITDDEKARLRASLERHGYVDPLVWNERSGHVVGGHQRLIVLKELGWTDVDVSVINVDDAQERALNLALNKTGGTWDDGALERVLEDLQANDATLLPFTGFSDAEIAALLGSPSFASVVVGDQDVLDEPQKPIECPACGHHFFK